MNRPGISALTVERPLADVNLLRIAELEAQLAEAQQTLDAIRNGEVDAVVVGGPENRRVYTLENADRSYRLLIEQMREGAVMFGEDAVVLYGNAALAALLGVPAERLLGSRFKRFVSDAHKAAFGRLLAGGGTAEISLRRPDGTSFPARLSLGELATDAGPVMCGVITDLTDTHAHALEMGESRARLAVETARREIDEQYRLILQSATEIAVLSIDVANRVTIWNTGAKNILGWDAEEVIGGPAPTIRTPEDRAAGAAELEFATASETGRAEVEGWRLRKDGSRFWANVLIMPLRSATGEAIGFVKILRDRTDQRDAAENQIIMINELNHRVKNTLATVQSIAAQTLRTSATREQALNALDERLVALSRAHNVLTRGSWESAQLSEVVSEALAAYGGPNERRIHSRGPDIDLPPRVALALSMAFHELATNAVKYGALSAAGGEVSVDWTLSRTPDARILKLVWAERGGPLVTPPLRRGFGSRLIERSLAAELGGEVVLAFAASGLVCTLEAVMPEPRP